MAWVDDVSPTCPACRAIYAARMPPEEPPCGACRVALRPENEEAAAVYLLTRRQVVTMGEQILDLHIPAVKIVMDLHGVQEQRACLGKVLRVFHQRESERRTREG